MISQRPSIRGTWIVLIKSIYLSDKKNEAQKAISHSPSFLMQLPRARARKKKKKPDTLVACKGKCAQESVDLIYSQKAQSHLQCVLDWLSALGFSSLHSIKSQNKPEPEGLFFLCASVGFY